MHPRLTLSDDQKQRLADAARRGFRAYVWYGLAGVAAALGPFIGLAVLALTVGGLVALAPFALWFGTLMVLFRYRPELFLIPLVTMTGNNGLPPILDDIGGAGRQATLDEFNT